MHVSHGILTPLLHVPTPYNTSSGSNAELNTNTLQHTAG